MSSPMVISVEGIDGAGKSSIATRLQEYLRRSEGVECLLLREPGSTPVGEYLRELLLNRNLQVASPWTQTLLFYAARQENIAVNIRPALDRGCWVVLDRFHDATLAYQGYGQGLSLDGLSRIYEIITDGFLPHWTILLDCSVETALRRLRERGDSYTYWEDQGQCFLARVRDGYLEIAQRAPYRVTVINAEAPLEEVWNTVTQALHERRERRR